MPQNESETPNYGGQILQVLEPKIEEITNLIDPENFTMLSGRLVLYMDEEMLNIGEGYRTNEDAITALQDLVVDRNQIRGAIVSDKEDEYEYGYGDRNEGLNSEPVCCIHWLGCQHRISDHESILMGFSGVISNYILSAVWTRWIKKHMMVQETFGKLVVPELKDIPGPCEVFRTVERGAVRFIAGLGGKYPMPLPTTSICPIPTPLGVEVCFDSLVPKYNEPICINRVLKPPVYLPGCSDALARLLVGTAADLDTDELTVLVGFLSAALIYGNHIYFQEMVKQFLDRAPKEA